MRKALGIFNFQFSFLTRRVLHYLSAAMRTLNMPSVLSDFIYCHCPSPQRNYQFCSSQFYMQVLRLSKLFSTGEHKSILSCDSTSHRAWYLSYPSCCYPLDASGIRYSNTNSAPKRRYFAQIKNHVVKHFSIASKR